MAEVGTTNIEKHIDLTVSVQWKAVTAINYVKQTFEAEVDIGIAAINGVSKMSKKNCSGDY